MENKSAVENVGLNTQIKNKSAVENTALKGQIVCELQKMF